MCKCVCEHMHAFATTSVGRSKDKLLMSVLFYHVDPAIKLGYCPLSHLPGTHFFFFWLHTFYFIFWYVTDFILESAAQAVLKFICSRAFNFWSSCLHLPSAVITAVHHHTQFIWCWESSVHVLSAALHPSPQSAFSYILLSTSWFLIKMKRVRRKQSAFQKMVLEKLDSHRQKMDFDNLIIIQTIYFKNFKWRLENWLSS